MKISVYKVLLLALAGLMLTACGGGSSSSPPPPPAAPTGVTATAKDGYVLVDATLAAGATGANVYYATTVGVSKTNGTKVSVGSSPQAITGLTNTQTYYFIVTAVGAGGESAISAEVSATPQAASVVVDPLYGDQWHLKSTGTQTGATTIAVINQDMNVEPVWTAGVKGVGVNVAVVDDGLEIGHEDLASNIAANSLSYNYVTGSNDPTNDPADTASGHGTAVAGIIAARADNGLGGRGVAPRATLIGYNLLQNSTTSNEADAMTRNAASVSVSSNSWGAADGTGELDTRSISWKTAIDSGLSTGRGTKGTVYTWAAGNGGAGSQACNYCFDNSNYDGRANYRGVMAIAAVNDQGKQSSYSELGANLWVSAPGGEFCNTHAISTTDRSGNLGFNKTGASPDYGNTKLNYTRCMNGTSSATPGVAGVVALMLAANPNLGWRDVRILLAQTARVNDSGDGGWALTGGTPQYWYNHKYGFGVVDAAAAVTAAQAYTTNVGTELTYTTLLSTSGATFLDFDPAGVTNSITVPNLPGGISSIEFVEVTFTAANTTYSGDIGVTLTSPSGTVSTLAVPHYCLGGGACTTSYNGWVFGSARHLGEAANGIWTLKVYDGLSDGASVGTRNFTSWQLKFYGN